MLSRSDPENPSHKGHRMTSNASPDGASLLPLCVDLDGTLVRSDLLVESVFALLKKNFFFLFLLPIWLCRGKAHLKSQIASRVEIDVSLLPYQAEFLEFLNTRHRAGGRLILATASDSRIANAIAGHLGVFDTVLASDSGMNLSGVRKLQAIRELFGENEFDYAGNGKIDIAIWRQANAAILVNPDRGVAGALSEICRVERVFENQERKDWLAYVKAIRLHQWLKNLLIFAPLMLAHRIDEPVLLLQAGVAFLSFGLCASSVYVLNDLFDLPFDRSHPNKHMRPLASGTVPIIHGMAMVPLLLLGSFMLALSLPSEFLAVLGLYYVVTLLYTLRLKHYAMIDVIVLASLYTLRILAGAAAVTTEPSFWLLTFSMFMFLSLALVKRYSELRAIADTGDRIPAGRSYRASDLPLLAQFGTASTFMSVLVLALYINSDSVRLLYSRPQVIWLLCPLILYIGSRVWLLAHRNSLHEDPVVFAMRDRPSQLLVGLGLVLLLIAT
jgi:4-hydroxybenzoate polyprenyltransferase